jgi:hypothetical protein
MPRFRANYAIYCGVYEGFGPAGLYNEFSRENFEFDAKDETEATRISLGYPNRLSRHYIPDQSGYCTIVLEELVNLNSGNPVNVIEKIKQQFPDVSDFVLNELFPDGKFTFKKSWLSYFEELKKQAEEMEREGLPK